MQYNGWLGGVMVRTLDLWLAVAGSNPGHDTASLHGYFWDRWAYFAGKLSWDITTTQVNSALHPSGVTKLSTSFGWGKGGNVISAGWQVTLCDLIRHVIYRSGVVISITNCYIHGLLTYLLIMTLLWIRSVIPHCCRQLYVLLCICSFNPVSQR